MYRIIFVIINEYKLIIKSIHYKIIIIVKLKTIASDDKRKKNLSDP